MITLADIERARYRSGPSIDAMRKSLPDVGLALNTACLELERELTPERLDRLMAQLNAAQTNLLHLRLAMVAEG
jgi:hypothetical protein